MALESWIDEIAREELKKLESQHPHRFGYLKTELKLLISEPNFNFNLESFFLLPEPISPSFAHCVSTQVSSNRKRNLDCDTVAAVPNKKLKKRRMRKEARSMHRRMKDKVETAIERAEACLERIREVKKSLIPPWLL